jgi:hypothetical protein
MFIIRSFVIINI